MAKPAVKISASEIHPSFSSTQVMIPLYELFSFAETKQKSLCRYFICCF